MLVIESDPFKGPILMVLFSDLLKNFRATDTAIVTIQ